MSENHQENIIPSEVRSGWVDETKHHAQNVKRFIADHIQSVREANKKGTSAVKYDSSSEFQIRGEQDDRILDGTLTPKEVSMLYEDNKPIKLHIRYYRQNAETEISLSGMALDDYLTKYPQ